MKKYNYFEIVVSVIECNAMQFSKNYAHFIRSWGDGYIGNAEFCLIVDAATLEEIEGLKEEGVVIVSKSNKVKGWYEISCGTYNAQDYQVIGKFCTLRGLMNRLHAMGHKDAFNLDYLRACPNFNDYNRRCHIDFVVFDADNRLDFN